MIFPRDGGAGEVFEAGSTTRRGEFCQTLDFTDRLCVSCLWEATVPRKKPQGKTAVMAAIMAAAAVLISKRGANSITLRDIARKANVNHGLIIRHFGSKVKLVKAVGFTCSPRCSKKPRNVM